MSALKITRRTVDAITFSEHWGGQFLPNIEDFSLDETIAASMSYGPPPGPRRRHVLPPQPPPPPPPSASVRSPGGRSPAGGRSPKFLSPRSQRKKLSNLSQIIETEPVKDDSFSELSATHSISDINQAVEEKVKARMAGVRFADDVEMNEISRLRDSVIAEVFYESAEIGTMSSFGRFLSAVGKNWGNIWCLILMLTSLLCFRLS